MKLFKQRPIDFVRMGEEEREFVKGYNAAIRDCNNIMAERRQLKKERKKLKTEGLLGQKSKGKGKPYPMIDNPWVPWPKLEEKLRELEAHIIDVDHTSGKRFAEIYDRVKNLENLLNINKS